MDAPSSPKAPPLLPAVAAGDSQAVSDFLDRYKGLVWWLARQLLTESEAEDAVQEVFVELWSNADRYDPAKSSEAAFVSMVARRRFIDRRRRAGRRPVETPLETVERERSDRGSAAIEACAEASLAKEAIGQLEEKERDVLSQAIFLGLSHSEIAGRTGLPLGTVKTYVRRGLSRVRDALQRATRFRREGVV